MRIEWKKEETSPAERSLESYTEKEKWASLSKRKRVRYLWDYYKLPFVIVFIVLYIIGFNIYRHVTHKDTILYTGLVNIAATEETTAKLSDDFFTYIDANAKKEECRLYTGWFLTTNKDSQYFEYTMASQIKILASIDDEQLDIVLLDRESFDAFSQNGYLYNIEELLQGTDLYDQLKPYIVSNIHFLEDNGKDINFDASIEFKATSEEFPMGLDVSKSHIFDGTSYSDTIYLGVIANTTRKEMVLKYLEYLYS